MVADFTVNVSTAFAQMAENIAAALQGRVAKTLDNSGLRTAIEKALGLDKPLEFKVPEAMPFADIFKETEATRREMEKLDKMTNELFEKQNKQRERQKNEDEQQRRGFVPNNRRKDLSGFLGFSDANRKLQEAMLKNDGPQQKMVGQLGEANRIAQRMDHKLEGIKVALQKTPTPRPVA